MFQELIKLRLLALSVSVNLFLACLLNSFRPVLGVSFVYIRVNELTVAIGSGNPAWWCLSTTTCRAGCI